MHARTASSVAEGCGLVVLKRLSDAQRDGDQILAVIRGTAVNQDGRSNGLTAPNGPSQTAVIRAALADAGLRAADLSYVETHGTGTSLGDPIEVQALMAALGDGRPASAPLKIGAVKANIGHAKSASGIAGFIKLVLMMQHAMIPPQIHFAEPNPHIAWAGSAGRGRHATAALAGAAVGRGQFLRLQRDQRAYHC